ncbi:Scr1 family TA system antitoxin-like transcriptional regulator [Actinophytocola sp.]|uniref:Scr1 family TA system antitoxin-like transcriptional regulator n=1 Tax=Actinophytocola sp. TaxID=1872138 RepID=UPI002D7EB36C|nr:Scr1 family TA system antitoxin-like transcriptional regulator [Actinophytocola sp.]HET9137728.1 Scr1 family TA system antitoxin-like transcriptional regulator [Actinophytocola sp.]
MAAPVRTVRKLLLGKEIEHMIAAAGKTQTEAGALIEVGQSRIAGLVNGIGAISVGDLVLLANGLGFTDPGYQDALLELRRDNHKRGFWTMGFNRAYSEEIRLMVDLERHADQIRSYQVEIMPGLVQCESYARALHADAPEAGVTLDDQVQARMARQDIYDKADPPGVHYVLSESCLRRIWGDRHVMREQIDYLIKLSDRPNVMIQVLPFDVPPGRRSPVGNRFTLVRVPSPGVAGPLELAYIESQVEIRYLDDKKALAAFDQVWARLSTVALSYAESRKFLRRVAQDFK